MEEIERCTTWNITLWICIGCGIGELLIHSHAIGTPTVTISSGKTSPIISYTRPLMYQTIIAISSVNGVGSLKLPTFPALNGMNGAGSGPKTDFTLALRP